MASRVASDEEWLRRSFMISPKIMTNQDMLRRELTEASFKFTDTTMGGNFAINPPPQFTHRADIVVPSRFTKAKGMGRYYSEAIDDRGQYIHMRFGVPQFNSLTGFFTNFYSHEAGTIANKGRAFDITFAAGKLIGSVLTAPIQPLLWFNKVMGFMGNKQPSKYYYLKPAMPLYWNAVQTLVNTIGVNMGLVGKTQQEGEKTIKGDYDPLPAGETSAIANSMSGISQYDGVWRDDGGIDVYKMATRAARLAVQNRKAVKKVLETDGSWEDIGRAMYEASTAPMNDPGPRKEYGDYIKAYHSLPVGTPKGDKGDSNDSEKAEWDKSDESGFGDFLESELSDGSAFVTFRVDDTGTVDESFSNSTGEPAIASKLNSMTSSNRDRRFSMADGNIGDGAISGVVEGVIDGVKGLVMGAADSVGLGGLAAFSGRAFADIPNIWTDSTADLPKMSYTIELRSPYGNPLSRFQNLYLPLSMILAGALPLSTGKASYTSPFLVELYSQGRNQTRLGIIDSLQITRGVGNLGWNRNNEPLGIDITFSVIDLSTIMHMPIVPKFGLIPPILDGITDGDTFDDDNLFTDYMAVLGGLSLYDQIYPINKLRLRSAIKKAEWQRMKSPAYHANWMAGTGIGQIASGIFTSTVILKDGGLNTP